MRIQNENTVKAIMSHYAEQQQLRHKMLQHEKRQRCLTIAKKSR